MKELTKIIDQYETDKGLAFVDKHGFSEFYDSYFNEIRKRAKKENRKVYILEVGIWKGGSLRAYNDYFGKENCEIFGLDYDLEICEYTEDNVHLLYVDQNDINLLKYVGQQNFKNIKFDIIIDDGGHHYNQQFNTLLAYNEYLDKEGIYIVEDLHTNIDERWGRFDDSPLNFFITGRFSSSLSVPDYNLLKKCIKNITIYKHDNPTSGAGCCSITSVLTMNN